MKQNQKGTGVVEVVISFTMLSLSFAIGMLGIASGSNYINAGAKLKNQQRSEAVVQMTDTTNVDITVKDVDDESTTYTIPAVEYSSEYFTRYKSS